MKKIVVIVATLVLLLLVFAPATYAAPPAQGGGGYGGGGGGGYGPGYGGWGHCQNCYRVQKGDTLFSIGRRFGVNPWYIGQFNGLPNPHRIYEGQVLYIPSGWGYSGYQQPGYGGYPGGYGGYQPGYGGGYPGYGGYPGGYGGYQPDYGQGGYDHSGGSTY